MNQKVMKLDDLNLMGLEYYKLGHYGCRFFVLSTVINTEKALNAKVLQMKAWSLVRFA